MQTIHGFKLRKLGDEYVLIGESRELINFDKMITLNESAAFLWQQAEKQTLDEGTFTTEHLIDALVEEYDIPRDQALKDVTATIAAFAQSAIIAE